MCAELSRRDQNEDADDRYKHQATVGETERLERKDVDFLRATLILNFSVALRFQRSPWV